MFVRRPGVGDDREDGGSIDVGAPKNKSLATDEHSSDEETEEETTGEAARAPERPSPGDVKLVDMSRGAFDSTASHECSNWIATT